MAQVSFPITTFQFPDTTAISNGYLIIQLNKDCTIPGVGQVGASIKVKVLLNNGGQPTTSVLFHTNASLSPSDSQYIYSVYSSAGQRVAGPIPIII
jgi:hypothetical protein